MKVALESHGGLKGCRAAVAEIVTANEVGKNNKIPNISLLNNFCFEKEGIHAWKAYRVRPGHLIRYDDLNIEQQGPTDLNVVQPFGSRHNWGERKTKSGSPFMQRKRLCSHVQE